MPYRLICFKIALEKNCFYFIATWGRFLIFRFLNCNVGLSPGLLLAINLAYRAIDWQFGSVHAENSLGRDLLIKDEMRLMDCSWGKITCAHNGRVDMTITNEVIITFGT